MLNLDIFSWNVSIAEFLTNLYDVAMQKKETFVISADSAKITHCIFIQNAQYIVSNFTIFFPSLFFFIFRYLFTCSLSFFRANSFWHDFERRDIITMCQTMYIFQNADRNLIPSCAKVPSFGKWKLYGYITPEIYVGGMPAFKISVRKSGSHLGPNTDHQR